jgi:hypothetical protein
MRAKELEGQWALKVDQGRHVDKIFYEVPVKLLKVTDTHITYQRGSRTQVYAIPTVANRGEWVSAKETLGDSFKNLMLDEDLEEMRRERFGVKIIKTKRKEK